MDAADYVMWRKTNGSAMDYSDWVQNFGGTSGSGGGAVPEPGALVMLLVAGVDVPRRRA